MVIIDQHSTGLTQTLHVVNMTDTPENMWITTHVFT